MKRALAEGNGDRAFQSPRIECHRSLPLELERECALQELGPKSLVRRRRNRRAPALPPPEYPPPPRRRHSNTSSAGSVPCSMRQEISMRPVGRLRAPYFSALVASS